MCQTTNIEPIWPTQWPKHDPLTPLWPTSAPNEPRRHQMAPNGAPPCLTATSMPNRQRRPPYDPDSTECLAPPPSPRPTLPTSMLGGPKTI
ncbi:hypothetical protein BDN67DRAFT_912568 [Paxillus ammoniavirescens]|nr:hypothetical protein BDN67DRAFT_912568 [Paxillus ammoniavirescens]